jgi:hypothetical protein
VCVCVCVCVCVRKHCSSHPDRNLSGNTASCPRLGSAAVQPTRDNKSSIE